MRRMSSFSGRCGLIEIDKALLPLSKALYSSFKEEKPSLLSEEIKIKKQQKKELERIRVAGAGYSFHTFLDIIKTFPPKLIPSIEIKVRDTIKIPELLKEEEVDFVLTTPFRYSSYYKEECMCRYLPSLKILSNYIYELPIPQDGKLTIIHRSEDDTGFRLIKNYLEKNEKELKTEFETIDDVPKFFLTHLDEVREGKVIVVLEYYSKMFKDVFKMKTKKIPLSSTTLLLVHKDILDEHPNTVKNFIDFFDKLLSAFKNNIDIVTLLSLNNLSSSESIKQLCNKIYKRLEEEEVYPAYM